MAIDAGGVYSYLDLDTSKFNSGMAAADGKMGAFSGKLKGIGDSMGAVGKKMTMGLTLPIAGMAAVAVKTAAGFDASMSQVAATMGMTADEVNNGSESFKLLEKAAMEMGATTKFSASESAEALNYLALAGYDAETSVAVLPKTLALAAAGGLELQYATDLVTDAAGALGLELDDLDGFIDQMAKTSQKSNTDVGQLGEAILVVGKNAADLKGGTIELNTAIGLLANVGIKGSEAGTKLRNIIMAMTPTTDAAANAFANMKIETYDASGEMRGLNEIMGDMSIAMDGLTTEEKKRMMNDIFNKQDMAAALTLLAATSQGTEHLGFVLGELGVPADVLDSSLDKIAESTMDYSSAQEYAVFAMEKWGLTTEQASLVYNSMTDGLEDTTAWANLSGEITDSKDAAQTMANTMEGNLQGSLTNLKSALEGAAIVIGKSLTPAIEKLIEWIKGAVSWFLGLDEKTQGLIVKITLLVAAIGPILLIVAKMITVITTITGAFTTLTAGTGILGAAFTFLTGPVGIVIAIVGVLVAAVVHLWKTNEDFRNAVIKAWEAIKVAISNAVQVIKNTIGTVIGAFKSVGDAISGWFVGLVADATNWGKNLIQGLWNGIANASAWLKSKVSGFVSNVKEWFTKPLKISSPSGVFEGYGENIVEGLNKGIEGQEDSANTTMTNLSSSIVEAFKPGMDEIIRLLKLAVGEVDIFNSTRIDDKSATVTITTIEETIRGKDAPSNNNPDFIENGVEYFTPSNHPTKRADYKPVERITPLETGGKKYTEIAPGQYALRAMGDTFFKGGLAMVGEQGRELLNLPRGTQIHSNQSTERMMSENVNHTGTITIKGVNNQNEFIGVVDMVMDQLRREVRL